VEKASDKHGPNTPERRGIMRVRLLGFALTISAALVLGCFLDAWSAERKEESESYKKQAEETLKALDKKIDELTKKAAEAKGDTRKEFDKDITELQKKQKAAKKKWNELKSAGATEWEKAKSEMTAVVQDLEKSYNELISRFKERKE
jgi:hypothetical protein